MMNVQDVAKDCGNHIGRAPGIVKSDGFVDGTVFETTELAKIRAPKGAEFGGIRTIRT